MQTPFDAAIPLSSEAMSAINAAGVMRMINVPEFLEDGRHTVHIVVQHPEGCECPWSRSA